LPERQLLSFFYRRWHRSGEHLGGGNHRHLGDTTQNIAVSWGALTKYGGLCRASQSINHLPRPKKVVFLLKDAKK